MIFIRFNYFVHCVDLKILNDLLTEKKLGFLSNEDEYFDKIHENDFILLSTKLNNKNIVFGYTNIKKVINEDISLYDCYKSKKILVLKGIVFFTQPLNSNFKLNKYFDYLMISENEFKSINPNNVESTLNLPFYLKNIQNITIGSFIKSTDAFLDNLIKNILGIEISEDKKKILLNEILSKYNIVIGENSYLNICDGENCFILSLSPQNSDLLNKKSFIDLNDFKNDMIYMIEPEDYVLLLNDSFVFAIGQVQYNLFNKYGDSLKYFKPQNTIKFKNIVKFNQIVSISILEDKSFNSVCDKLNRGDINIIEDNFYYLEEFSFGNLEEFIIKSGKVLFDLINNITNLKIFEIKEFLRILRIYLSSYGIDFSQDDLEKFFKINAYKFKFKYTPSRDSHLLMDLKFKQNKIKQFSYLVMR